MKSPEKEAERWFSQAQDDLRFVEWLLKGAVFFDKGCFISQQAGEKALKACLYATGKRHVIGHSLFEMVDELSSMAETFKAAADLSRRLDRFYIPTRYPNGLPGGSPFEVYTKKDLDDAYEDLNSLFKICRDFLAKKNVLK